MIESSLGSMSLSHREQYTSVALKRSATIEYCAPMGYFKLIHAVALAAFDGNPRTIGEIREKYDQSSGGSKNIMVNLGKLTAQPFPVVVSRKKISMDSELTKVTPLLDVSTGITASEKYSSVALSDLGRLLTRHYNKEPMDFSDHYKSIVPLSLLRKSVPWTMGHRSEMYPLNPNELFRIMIKMMEINSPFIKDTDLEEIFRGFDMGENYDIYMTSSALLSLYTKGESSFMIMPSIEIRRHENKIVIKAPPMNTSTKKLASYLDRKSVNQANDGYKTFRYKTEVLLIDKGAQLEVTEWIGTDEEILEELKLDRFITRKSYTRNETIKYKEGYDPTKGDVEDGTLGTAKIPISLLEIDELRQNFTEEELVKLGAKEIIDNLDQLHLITGVTNRESERKHYREIMGDSGIRTESLKSSNFQITKNPYPFELDIAPVFEVLWQCIQWEKECQIKRIQTELSQLREKLKLDILLEKITRPEVAALIHKLHPEPNTNKNKLMELCKPGSEILPEGFQRWEVELIYADSANNYLPKIFQRNKFKHLYIATQKTIKELEDLLNSPTAIMDMIKTDLEKFTNNPEYDRKSKVYFMKDEVSMKIDHIPVKDSWDEHDLPCTLFYDDLFIRRNYGVNKYFKDFLPLHEINTTNDSKVAIIHRTPKGEIMKDIMKVSRFPISKSAKLPPSLIGILPVEKDLKQKVMFWTNHSRYYIYQGVLTQDLEFESDEKILGWTYLDEENRYLDIRSSNGVQTVMTHDFPMFKTTLKNFPGTMGLVYDILPKSKNDNIAKLWVGTKKDYQKFGRVMLKSKTAMPIELEHNLYSKVFTPHLNRYYESVYMWDWNLIGLTSEHKYLGLKQVYLQEYAYVEGTKTSKRILDSVRRMVRAKYTRKNLVAQTDQFVIARYSKSYLDFKPEEHKDTYAVYVK